MAAQKLTRERLIQIIILMIILVSAFVWRTVTYQVKTPIQMCSLNIGSCSFNINNKPVTVTLTSKILEAETPITLHVDNINVNPSATVSSVTMNMGVLPIIFTAQKKGWQGEFTVPKGIQDKMTWVIDIKINQKIHSVEFTVTK